jgi:hypothetical protein
MVHELQNTLVGNEPERRIVGLKCGSTNASAVFIGSQQHDLADSIQVDRIKSIQFFVDQPMPFHKRQSRESDVDNFNANEMVEERLDQHGLEFGSEQ